MLKGQEPAVREAIDAVFTDWLVFTYEEKYPISWDGKSGQQILLKLKQISLEMVDQFMVEPGMYKQGDVEVSGKPSMTILKNLVRSTPTRLWPGATVYRRPSARSMLFLQRTVDNAKKDWKRYLSSRRGDTSAASHE
jgi:hypothetical protein